MPMPLLAIPKLALLLALPAAELPSSIQQAQSLMVAQGTCEANWKELSPVQTYELPWGAKLWLVPCAQWSVNPATSVFVTFPHRLLPEGIITKPQFFVSYSKFMGGLFANNVIHNVRWNKETQSLEAAFNTNGSDFCGSRSRYEWNRGTQVFDVKEIWKQDNCENAEARWERVL